MGRSIGARLHTRPSRLDERAGSQDELEFHVGPFRQIVHALAASSRCGPNGRRREAMNTKPVLVLGGTGKTGRRIVERLTARNVPVRVGSRSATPRFEWEKPETWPAAVSDVDSVYISFYPDLAVPGAVDVIRAFTRTAVTGGVRRLVLLSGRGEHEAERCEEIVRAAGAQWTILRASWFAQNFSESYLLDPILAGEVVLPAGRVGEPFVDADDIADVA